MSTTRTPARGPGILGPLNSLAVSVRQTLTFVRPRGCVTGIEHPGRVDGDEDDVRRAHGCRLCTRIEHRVVLPRGLAASEHAAAVHGAQQLAVAVDRRRVAVLYVASRLGGGRRARGKGEGGQGDDGWIGSCDRRWRAIVGWPEPVDIVLDLTSNCLRDRFPASRRAAGRRSIRAGDARQDQRDARSRVGFFLRSATRTPCRS